MMVYFPDENGIHRVLVPSTIWHGWMLDEKFPITLLDEKDNEHETMPTDTTKIGFVTDGPIIPLLSAVLQVRVSISFETYLMFRPDKMDACWVPLRVAEWKWDATATQVLPLSWFRYWVSVGTPEADETGAVADRFPTWSDNAKDYRTIWDDAEPI